MKLAHLAVCKFSSSVILICRPRSRRYFSWRGLALGRFWCCGGHTTVGIVPLRLWCTNFFLCCVNFCHTMISCRLWKISIYIQSGTASPMSHETNTYCTLVSGIFLKVIMMTWCRAVFNKNVPPHDWNLKLASRFWNNKQIPLICTVAYGLVLLRF